MLTKDVLPVELVLFVPGFCQPLMVALDQDDSICVAFCHVRLFVLWWINVLFCILFECHL